MKPIKFRVWDIYIKQMDYSPAIGSEDLNLGIDEMTDILMQFTGLLDKNGKEIYDGDIIREHFNPHLNLWEICDNQSYFTAEGRGYRFPLFSLQYPIEVIGNIYEQPELKLKLL